MAEPNITHAELLALGFERVLMQQDSETGRVGFRADYQGRQVFGWRNLIPRWVHESDLYDTLYQVTWLEDVPDITYVRVADAFTPEQRARLPQYPIELTDAEVMAAWEARQQAARTEPPQLGWSVGVNAVPGASGPIYSESYAAHTPTTRGSQATLPIPPGPPPPFAPKVGDRVLVWWTEEDGICVSVVAAISPRGYCEVGGRWFRPADILDILPPEEPPTL